MTEAETKVWFPEPAKPHEQWAGRGEHTLDWLARSTLPRARACRTFLNRNLNALPVEAQQRIFDALRPRWKSAFFELIVMRVLQALGATISAELALEDGKRPDIVAQFRDVRVTVEAVSPVFDGHVGELIKARIPLLEIIEAAAPEGWSVFVWELPNIGLSDPKAEFKRAINAMFTTAIAVADSELQEVVADLPAGRICLGLMPRRIGDRAVIVEPPLTTIDNSEERIRSAVKRKRRQVRNSATPVLLAVEGSGISSDFEAFDQALFGREHGTYVRGLGLVSSRFVPDGMFTKPAQGEPTYAGVLAFLSIGFQAGPPPILYMHPRFAGVLPEKLLRLEQRRYEEGYGIRAVPSRLAEFREDFGFITRDD